MKSWEFVPWSNWSKVVRSGAMVGFMTALIYGTVATLYIILRSSAQIVAVLTPAEGLWGTLAANAISVIWPCLVTTLLLGLLAAIIEIVAFSIIYGLFTVLNGRRSPFWGAAIGFVVSSSLALLVNLLVVQGISAYWDAFWSMGYLFWLGLPSSIFVGMTTWLCWQGEARRIGYPLQEAKC